MTDAPIALPLLRLGLLELDPGLRALQPGLAASDLVVIASGPVSGDSDDQLSARIGAALDGITAEDAIVVRLLARTGPLAGQPVAASVRRGQAA